MIDWKYWIGTSPIGDPPSSLCCPRKDGPPFRWSPSAGAGEPHAERGAAAGALFHPSATLLQLGEPSDEREPHAGARRVLRARRALPERFEDRLAQLRRNARSVVFDDDQRAAEFGSD